MPRRPRAHRTSHLVALMLAANAGLTCGDAGPCDGFGDLCQPDHGLTRILNLSVADATVVDLDGDGTSERVALSTTAHQVTVAFADGRRSLLFLEQSPVALAALPGAPGELAVALADPPAVAIFGLDSAGHLERRRDLPLTHEPYDLWSGDLDGDTNPELVVVQSSSGQLAVLDPRTGDTRLFAAGTTPVAVAAGDLDGDGTLDLIAADYTRASLQVLRGAGEGNYNAAREVPGTAAPDSLTIVDHDGDGDLDVLTRSPVTTSISAFLNNNSGQLAPPIELPLNVSPTGTGIAASSNPGAASSVSVPQGGLLSTGLFSAGAWLGRVETSMNDARWIGGDPSTGGLLVGGDAFLTQFTDQRAIVPLEVWRTSATRGGDTLSAIATGDLDGDGLIDFAISAYGVLYLYRGTDLGFEPVTSVKMDRDAEALAIAEVTGDGRPDIVISDGDAMHLLQQQMDGSFVLRAPYFPTVLPSAITTLVTGPGAPSAVAISPISLLTFVASGSEYPPGAALIRFASDGAAEATPFAEEIAVARLVASDLDGDGVDEAVLLGLHDALPVLIRMTLEDDVLVPGAEHDLSALSGLDPNQIHLGIVFVGDLDMNGTLDVSITAPGGSLRIEGLADDTPVATLVPASVPSYVRDVDDDGHLDLIFVGVYGDLLIQRGLGSDLYDLKLYNYYFPNNSGLAFVPDPAAKVDLISVSRNAVAAHRIHDVMYPVRSQDTTKLHGDVRELATADIDNDGHDEIVTLARTGGLAVLWGGPEGALDRADGFNDDFGNRGLALGDLDGDGSPEVVSSNVVATIDAYRVHPQFEPLHLSFGNSLNIQTRVEDLVVTDLDRDGHPDILAVAWFPYEGRQTTLYVTYGIDTLEFGEWTPLLSLPGISDGPVYPGDVDGDGDIDLLLRTDEGTVNNLLLAEAPRTWAEPLLMPGPSTFGPPDADGKVDLYVQDGTSLFRPTVANGVVGKGDVILRPENIPYLLRSVGDADGDGRVELVLSNDDDIEIWTRDKDGYHLAFTLPTTLAAVSFADIDGDRRPDLVGIQGDDLVVRRAAH